MTSFRLSIDLEASIETVIVICTVILIIVWMVSKQQYRQSSIPLGLNSIGNDLESGELESESGESECRSDNLSEEEWTPTLVHSAYAEFYDRMCEEELGNLENYSPK
jgi:hypothetical protein